MSNRKKYDRLGAMADHALYLEVDEDITSAIDKLRKAPGASVQIVVPKRSGILQSIINLKLLKKAAADAGKELVLVTNDKIAGDLAGRIGIPVAAAIGSRPVINEPSRPEPKNYADEVIEADDPAPSGDLIDISEATPKTADSMSKLPAFSRRDIDKPRPIAAAPVIAATSVAAEAEASTATANESVSASSRAASGIPSFSKLQRRLGWVGLAIALVAGYSIAMYYLTSANVKLFALGTKVNVDGTFVADKAATKSDTAAGVLAAQEVTFSKDATSPVTPTGQKDNGTMAHGTVTFKNCEDTSVYPLAGGNTITSQGLAFTTDNPITIPAGTFSGGGKNCTSPTVSVPVTASKNGDAYNLTNASFSSPKLTSNFVITSPQLSGGTSKIVMVLTQSDVDKAQADILAKDKDASTTAVIAKVTSDSQALPDSLVQAASAVSPSPAIGAEAQAATVSIKINYTILAVKKTDYKALIDGLEQKQIGSKSQIYDDGLASAKVASNGKDEAGRPSFSFSALAYGGTKLDTAAIATQLKGKKYGEATTYAGGQPGVDHVEITVWPAWSTSLPKRPSRIHVTVFVANSKG